MDWHHLTHGLLMSWAAADPDAANAWFERVVSKAGAQVGEESLNSMKSSLEEGSARAKMHSDPMAAIEDALKEGPDHMRAWFSDVLNPEHWTPLATMASERVAAKPGAISNRDHPVENCFGYVADSMLRKLGFEEAWRQVDALGVDSLASSRIRERLASSDLGPQASQRFSKLVEGLSGEERYQQAEEIVASWAISDPVAAASWVADVLPESDRLLEELAGGIGHRSGAERCPGGELSPR